MKMIVITKIEAHTRVKDALDLEVKRLERLYSGLKGRIIRKANKGVNPLIFRYIELGVGQFQIEAMSTLGDLHFAAETKKQLLKEFGTDIIEIRDLKECD